MNKLTAPTNIIGDSTQNHVHVITLVNLSAINRIVSNPKKLGPLDVLELLLVFIYVYFIISGFR